ncbi:hypothetical protein [Vibrio fluvialis]|uniref:hypothetical protein n=1 Tax=Vibrio fluvialis TaxID=676 RepID=UPI003D7EF810
MMSFAREITRKPRYDGFELSQWHLIAGLPDLNGCSVVSRVFKTSKSIAVFGFQSVEFIGQLSISHFIVVESQARVFRHLSFGTRHCAIGSKYKCSNSKGCHEGSVPLSAGNSGKYHSAEKYLKKHHEVIGSTPESVKVFFQSVAVEDVKFLLVACHVNNPIVGAAVVAAVVVVDEGNYPFFLEMDGTPASLIPSNNHLVAYIFYWLLGGTSTKEASLCGLVYQNRTPVSAEDK